MPAMDLRLIALLCLAKWKLNDAAYAEINGRCSSRQRAELVEILANLTPLLATEPADRR